MSLDGDKMIQDTGRKHAVCLWLQIKLESECKRNLGRKPLEVEVIEETISILWVGGFWAGRVGANAVKRDIAQIICCLQINSNFEPTAALIRIPSNKE
jgi:hypothetical protein